MPWPMPSWLQGRARSPRRSGVSSVACTDRSQPTSSWYRSSRSGHAPASGNGRRSVLDEPTKQPEDIRTAACSSGATHDRRSALPPANDGARHQSSARCTTPASAQRQSCHMGAPMSRGERTIGRCLRLSMRRVADSRTVLPCLVPWPQWPCQAARRARGGAPVAGADGNREQSWWVLLKKPGSPLRTAACHYTQLAYNAHRHAGGLRRIAGFRAKPRELPG